MSVTPTLYNFKQRENAKGKESVYAFLACIQRDESLAASLQGKGGVQRTIAHYTIPKTCYEDDCHYKVQIDMCTGTEHVFVEALNLRGGWENNNVPPGTTLRQAYTQEWSGSFSSHTLGGAGHFLESWIREAATLTNEDGSYLTEGQLRVYFGTYMREIFCGGHGRCGGKCCAMPGDTIFWQFHGGARVVTRWEPATDEELRERGWLTQGGILARYCELYREDPS